MSGEPPERNIERHERIEKVKADMSIENTPAANSGNGQEAVNWTQEEAIMIACLVEEVSPTFGCHVGLTGGLLYKDGHRKDCDLILYRIRQWNAIDFDGLFIELETIGITKTSGFGFCIKARYKGKRIDFLCPEEEGDYDPEEDGADQWEPPFAMTQTDPPSSSTSLAAPANQKEKS